MQQTHFTFASPHFRSSHQITNPQNNNSHEHKHLISSTQTHKNHLSFQKPKKHLFFVDDQSQSDHQPQKTIPKHKHMLTRKAPQSGLKSPFNQYQQNKEYSPEMIELLQNCKASIESLQEELDQKCLSLKKLEKQKFYVSEKLLESQKQTQRIQQILNIYIKESKQKNHSENDHLSQSKKALQSQLKSQLSQIQTINESLIKENQHLKNINNWLHFEANQLKTQNYILNQKLHKMGKGIGKALTTIKKNNKSSEKVSEFILVSEKKLPSKVRQHGKILTHQRKQKKQSKKSAEEQIFQTPTKINQSNTVSTIKTQKSVSFYEASQERLADITRKAKRMDQLQNLEQILSKMQKLAEQDHQSSENLSH